jgi:hypothetical protein
MLFLLTFDAFKNALTTRSKLSLSVHYAFKPMHKSIIKMIVGIFFVILVHYY